MIKVPRLVQRLLTLFWILTGAFAGAGRARAAACCGGGGISPQFLSSDDRMKIALSFAQGWVVAEALDNEEAAFRADGDTETFQDLNLSAAFLLADRWQAAFTLPFERRQRSVGGNTASSSGIADASVSLAWEALPEWDYSLYRPRLLLYTQLVFPTGTPLENATSTFQVDARGRGYLTPSAGALATKAWERWDALFRLGFGHSFTRRSLGSDLDSGWGVNLGLGGGYRPGNREWRLGLGLNGVFEDSVQSRGLIQGQSKPQLYWTTIASLTRSFGPAWNLTLSYRDQSLFGPAKNAFLNRSLALDLEWALPR